VADAGRHPRRLCLLRGPLRRVVSACNMHVYPLATARGAAARARRGGVRRVRPGGHGAVVAATGAGSGAPRHPAGHDAGGRSQLGSSLSRVPAVGAWRQGVPRGTRGLRALGGAHRRRRAASSRSGHRRGPGGCRSRVGHEPKHPCTGAAIGSHGCARLARDAGRLCHLG
jgi:hypothetical protein